MTAPSLTRPQVSILRNCDETRFSDLTWSIGFRKNVAVLERAGLVIVTRVRGVQAVDRTPEGDAALEGIG